MCPVSSEVVIYSAPVWMLQLTTESNECFQVTKATITISSSFSNQIETNPNPKIMITENKLVNEFEKIGARVIM